MCVLALKSLRVLNLGSCQQMNDNCFLVLAGLYRSGLCQWLASLVHWWNMLIGVIFSLWLDLVTFVFYQFYSAVLIPFLVRCIEKYRCLVMLPAIPSLVTLILENTAVTDAGLIHYASSCPPLLKNLDLSRTSVTQNIFKPLRGTCIVNRYAALTEVSILTVYLCRLVVC